MKKHLGLYALLFMLGLLSFGVVIEASNQDSFWTEAAQGGMAEVMMAQTALQKTQNEEVRSYAQKMIDDHTSTNDELKSLAASKNVTLPADVSAKQKETMTKMSARTGTDFDREYIKTQVKDHEKMVKLYQRQSERGTDADAKAFAAKTLPTLQMHLQMARGLNDRLKNTGGDRNTNSNLNNSNRSTNSNTNDNRR